MDFLHPLSFDPKTIDPNDQTFPLSPLADPVAGAIFANAEVAGLASESFINAVHKAENEDGMKGKVIRVTPQPSSISATGRGCRVDVETETDANEYYRYEIEIAPSTLIMVRDLFSASHFFVEKSTKGDTHSQMAKKMPKVVYINILGHIIRKMNDEMVQPVKFVYTKPPQEVAVDKIGIYNIQLPRVLDMKQDFDNNLYCWCYTLYVAHTERKTVKEVISMNPALQAYATRDAGFQQFSDRHTSVSADPKTRRDYVSWFGEMLREEGRIDAAWQEGYAEAEKRHKDELLTSARNMKNEGMTNEAIARMLPLSIDEIENALAARRS
jgi:predicted transposase/invertase (TIGR01784 family)